MVKGTGTDHTETISRAAIPEKTLPPTNDTGAHNAEIWPGMDG